MVDDTRAEGEVPEGAEVEHGPLGGRYSEGPQEFRLNERLGPDRDELRL